MPDEINHDLVKLITIHCFRGHKQHTLRVLKKHLLNCDEKKRANMAIWYDIVVWQKTKHSAKSDGETCQFLGWPLTNLGAILWTRAVTYVHYIDLFITLVSEIWSCLLITDGADNLWSLSIKDYGIIISKLIISLAEIQPTWPSQKKQPKLRGPDKISLMKPDFPYLHNKRF